MICFLGPPRLHRPRLESPAIPGEGFWPLFLRNVKNPPLIIEVYALLPVGARKIVPPWNSYPGEGNWAASPSGLSRPRDGCSLQAPPDILRFRAEPDFTKP